MHRERRTTVSGQLICTASAARAVSGQWFAPRTHVVAHDYDFLIRGCYTRLWLLILMLLMLYDFSIRGYYTRFWLLLLLLMLMLLLMMLMMLLLVLMLIVVDVDVDVVVVVEF